MNFPYSIKLLLFFLTTGVVSAQTGADLFSVGELADILGYPEGRLNVSDLTKEGKERYGSGLVAAFKIESSDRTFAPMTFVIASEGMILSPAMEGRLLASYEAARADPEVEPVVRKIHFDDDAYGFVGLAGIGAGGTEEMIVATLPGRGLDIQVKIAIPGDTILDFDSETESYYRLITEGRLEAQLVECMKLTMEVAVSLHEGASTQILQVDSRPETTPLVSSSTQLIDVDSTAPADIGPWSKRPIVFLVFALAAILILFVIIIRKCFTRIDM